MTKLFVGGLAYSVTNSQLEETFKQFGQVQSAQVITDKYSGQSKGFGFVEMVNDEEAQKAILELNGKPFEGRTLGVSVARPREENRDRSFSNDRGGDRGGSRGGNDRSSFNRGGRR